MNSYTLETSYRGAQLKLVLDTNGTAKLSINGMLRDETIVRTGQSALTLSSSVQTDYEWHELIEAHVQIHNHLIAAQLLSNNVEVAREEFSFESPNPEK